MKVCFRSRLGGRIHALALCVGLSTGTLASATVPAAGPGRFLSAPDGTLAEELALSPAVAEGLAALAPGQTALFSDWPWAPGERVGVALTAHDIYDQRAMIWAVTPTGPVSVPRSRLRFFWGPTDRGGLDRLLVELDPDTLRLSARSFGESAGYRLEPPESAGGVWRLTSEPAAPDASSWSCGQQADPLVASSGSAPRPSFATDGDEPELISTLHTATVAVDTDNELLNRKFSNNTTSATTYLAELFAAMNVIYERDVLVRLLQGTTFLRPSTTADPYVQPCGAAVTDCQTATASNTDRLNEFSNYWAAGCGGSGQPSCTGVTRALAMMLSGKQSSTNSSSGIAWLDALCSTGIGYSFTQVFKFAGATGASDAFVVGHELGHNFGSPHTHCYSPAIDNCYNAEGGCFSGTTSCPAATTINGVTNVRGTLMSYCHVLGGCSASQVFHPRTVNEQVGPLIQSSVGTCIFPFDPFAAGFRDGFESGLVPPWSGKRP